MPRNQEEGSASWIVDQIFDGYPEDAKRYYADRLRCRYMEPNVRKHLQYCTEKRKGPGEKHGGAVLSNSESALNYFRNLLLLDELLKRPSDVFKALGSDGKSYNASDKPISLKEENFDMGNMIRARRYELEMRAKPINDVLEKSRAWESIPDSFEPYRDDLNSLEEEPRTKVEPKTYDSWKAKLAEAVIEIEESDEWQNGSPEKCAQKADLYLKMGFHGLARQQVDSEITDHPEDPSLNYVNAQLLLHEASEASWQAFTHQTLHQEAPPMSGEEAHHEEQLYEKASSAHNKAEEALVQLMACYRNWDERKLQKWAYPHCQEIHRNVFFKIIDLADYFAGVIHAQHNWHKAQPTDLIEKIDGPLSRLIIGFFTEKRRIEESHMSALLWAENFGILLRYWSLMHRVKPIACSKSVKAWRKSVEESYEAKAGSWQWFKLNDLDQIRAEVAWSNPWPKLIHAHANEEKFYSALDIAKVPNGFLKSADKVLAQQQADHRLWHCLVFEWRGLSRNLASQSSDALKLCRQAYKRLPWSKSDYSNVWKLRWLYAIASCHFDMVIRAWPTDIGKARENIEELERLLEKHPEVGDPKATMLTTVQSDEFEEYESPRDLLGNYGHIFTDSDTNLISRAWGLFSDYHPYRYNLERPLPLERHYAFAEACHHYDGSLYEKARALVSNE
jgi:hypothetical protein